MGASKSESLAITVSENVDPNESIDEKGSDPINPSNQLSIGQELNLGIVNQYGQLVGDYSKLDDELWLPKTEEEEEQDDAAAMEMGNDGVQFGIVASHEKMFDLNRPLAYDDVEPLSQMEPLSGYADHPVSDGCTAPVNENNWPLNDSSENPTETPSPVSVLKRKRSYSNDTGTPDSQNKYCQPTRDGSSGGFRFSGSNIPTREQSQVDQSESEYSMESSLSDETDEPIPLQAVRTRRISDLLDLNHSKQAVKKCLHCESTETPQWRTGPMGRKTLCNACGVQFKHGRLFDNYRPLRSPTFDPSLHFSVPKKVQELSMGYKRERSPNVASKTKKVKEVKRVVDSERDPDFTLKSKKVKEMSMGNRFVRVPYSTLEPNKVQEHSMDNTCERIPNPTPNPEYAEEVRMSNDNGSGPNLATEPRRPEEMGMNNDSNVGLNLISELASVVVSLGNDNDAHKRSQKYGPGLILQRKQKLARKCAHCGSTETPQWREGPMGRFTLCNACGVQYRNGRLFPEYRPLRSPTYDPLLHSHLPKKVLEMRMRRAENCATSGNGEDPA